MTKKKYIIPALRTLDSVGARLMAGSGGLSTSGNSLQLMPPDNIDEEDASSAASRRGRCWE